MFAFPGWLRANWHVGTDKVAGAVANRIRHTPAARLFAVYVRSDIWPCMSVMWHDDVLGTRDAGTYDRCGRDEPWRYITGIECDDRRTVAICFGPARAMVVGRAERKEAAFVHCFDCTRHGPGLGLSRVLLTTE